MSSAQATYVKDSGSIQSHLSASNSQKRVRATLASVATREQSPNDTHITITTPTNLVSRAFLRLGLVRVPALPGATYDRHTSTRAWSILLVKWIAVVYCLLSCIVLTIDCYKYLRVSLANDDALRPASYMNDLPLHHRLSRIAPSQNILNIEPYLLGNAISEDGGMAITACLWIKDTEDLNLLMVWTRSWPGPLSVLMSTTATTASPAHVNLLKKIYNLKKRLRKAPVFLHLLHIKTHNSSAPNIYLNLARFFAPTSRVVLFPAPTAHSPPRELYHLVATQSMQYPAIITTPSMTTYPFMPLSPVFLYRNHNAWCTERCFVHSHRVADWQECLWQIWAESLGKATKIIIRNDADGQVNDEAQKADVVHARMSSIFRSEYCDLAIRNLTLRNRDAKLSLNWLKHFCAESIDKRYRM